MTESLSISGQLKGRDLKRLVRLSRTGTVGPTTLYYAGLTAPIISASVALLAKDAALAHGWSEYWQWLFSALLAALAGITWYVIFMRWSYRHKQGRGTERSQQTEITAAPDGLLVRRGAVETRIGWQGVRRIVAARGHLAVFVEGADTLIIPDDWFGRDAARRAAFTDYVTAKVAC